VLPDIAGELLSFFRNFRPGLLPVRRGEQKSNSYSNSHPEGKTNNIPTRAVVIVLSESICRARHALRGSLVRFLRQVTNIFNVVSDPLSGSFSGTIGLVQNEKTGSECNLKKLLHIHNSPPSSAQILAR
jgi:hypothetical protein